jgi:uncharacterized membrane protein YdbT with pleckstrin-like domain
MDLHPGEQIVFEGHPSWRSTLRFYVIGLLAVAAAAGIAYLVDGTGLAVAAALVVGAIIVLAGLAKRAATNYVVTNQRLHIRRGLLSRNVQQTRIERIQNVSSHQSLGERLLRVGTVEFDTASDEDGDFVFGGIADPAAVVAAVDRAQREGPGAAPGPDVPASGV